MRKGGKHEKTAARKCGICRIRKLFHVECELEERTAARKAKDWAKADAIRDQLSAMGIVLEDTPAGIRWKRSGN